MAKKKKKDTEQQAAPTQATDESSEDDIDDKGEPVRKDRLARARERRAATSSPLRNWIILLALVAAGLAAFAADEGLRNRLLSLFGPKKLPPHLPKLSGGAFDGNRLKHAGGYSGSALVIFTAGGAEDSPLGKCPKCYDDKLEMRRSREKLSSYKEQVKFASVDCTAHAQLCERFAVVLDSDASKLVDEGSGEVVKPLQVPQVAWFRDGVMQEMLSQGNADSDGDVQRGSVFDKTNAPLNGQQARAKGTRARPTERSQSLIKWVKDKHAKGRLDLRAPL